MGEAEAARATAAGALRRLGHALVAHEMPPEHLLQIAERASLLADEITGNPRRRREIEEMKRRAFMPALVEGSPVDHFADCVVSGKENPMGIAIDVWKVSEVEVVSRVTLGPAFEGAPGRAHGGIVAAIFDDTMGGVLTVRSRPAFTAWLRVEYHHPTPMGVELEFRARLDDEDGRKLYMSGEAIHEDVRFASATALFIAIPREQLGLPD